MWALSRSAAHECCDTDILVNMIFPGPTATPIWGREMTTDGTDALIEGMPFLRSADETYECARILATLPTGGPAGVVYTPMKGQGAAEEGNGQYRMFAEANDRLPKMIERRRKKVAERAANNARARL